MRLGWWEMLCAARSVLPEDLICFDSRFASYEETADGVTVRFSSRGGDETAYSARVLVGADGGFSGVRRQCLDDGLPKSPGTVLWRARVPAESMAGLLQGGVIERSWIGGRMFGNAWLVNSKTGEGAWVGATHKTKLEEMGVDFKTKPGERTGMQVLPIGPTAHQRALTVLAGMPEDYQAMLRATDPASVVEHGTWARDIDPGQPWGKGAVTLVGDAAHPIRPVTGQGFGQAAEDAHELAGQLAARGFTAEALRAYEAARVQRMKRVANTEWELGEMAYAAKGQDALAVQAAKLKQDNYADFLFSKEFQPLGS
jgi:salicylate hydroxylase